LSWVWVDTCCINKESSSELSEAINTMYQWYASSDRCYAYLYDMDDFALPADCDEKRFPGLNGWPKWFSQGWTLQELVAPSEVNFFNRCRESILSTRYFVLFHCFYLLVCFLSFSLSFTSCLDALWLT
ncbi:hypothetical protein EDC04DRAFT_2578630, partial [Pisolithus marmoratus]